MEPCAILLLLQISCGCCRILYDTSDDEGDSASGMVFDLLLNLTGYEILKTFMRIISRSIFSLFSGLGDALYCGIPWNTNRSRHLSPAFIPEFSKPKSPTKWPLSIKFGRPDVVGLQWMTKKPTRLYFARAAFRANVAIASKRR